MLAEDVRKEVPGSLMFADDIVLCGSSSSIVYHRIRSNR